MKKNHRIDIVSPGSNASDEFLQTGIQFLSNWGLKSYADAHIFGPDLLYTNSNIERYRCLDQAIRNPNSWAIWCLRGGSGSTRIIPFLERLQPLPEKIFIGFSDITALHLYFYKNWGWQTCLHGPVLKQISYKTVDTLTTMAIKNLLLHGDKPPPFALQALNDRVTLSITGPLHGGNLSLIQSSLSTSWHIDAKEHILIVEDVNEQPYRIAERLEHLRQAKVFNHIKALIFGDFNYNQTPCADEKLINQVLKQFANEVDFPVFQGYGIGHTVANWPFYLGSQAEISSCDEAYILQAL